MRIHVRLQHVGKQSLVAGQLKLVTLHADEVVNLVLLTAKQIEAVGGVFRQVHERTAEYLVVSEELERRAPKVVDEGVNARTADFDLGIAALDPVDHLEDFFVGQGATKAGNAPKRQSSDLFVRRVADDRGKPFRAVGEKTHVGRRLLCGATQRAPEVVVRVVRRNSQRLRRLS